MFWEWETVQHEKPWPVTLRKANPSKIDMIPPRKMEDPKENRHKDQVRVYTRSVEKIRKAEYPLLEGPPALLLNKSPSDGECIRNNLP
jgi:hypothetical protein